MARELRHYDMVGSMGRVGAAGDNAAMESFWSLLQTNVLNQNSRATRQDLRLAIVVWIERKYHRQRAQDALGGLTPIEFEAKPTEPQPLAAQTEPVTSSFLTPGGKHELPDTIRAYCRTSKRCRKTTSTIGGGRIRLAIPDRPVLWLVILASIILIVLGLTTIMRAFTFGRDRSRASTPDGADQPTAPAVTAARTVSKSASDYWAYLCAHCVTASSNTVDRPR